ncbi:homoserine kinase [Clostridium sp. DJ247]|uniref:homoserine kinase n=1 Tax=Clostridium sp. DJ247 TaxID=2726188 RepID=UPI00162827F8|nr:homoserine kinase [Clostridium sp. DJ247]MBC2580528.1 homoserine kinase [Clostridium sp. DJ247]
MIKVRIPATTANMGPGFDCLGMALKFYNEFEISENNEETIVFNNGIKSEEDYKENLIYISMVKAFEKFNYKYGHFTINVSKCEVPLSRGLGSSATCIVGGISAANAFMGNKMSMDEIVELSTEIEGHPDNVVPAAVGGMAVSIQNGHEVTYSKIKVPNELKFAAIIPSFKVSTEKSREVLPKAYVREDCIFNSSRTAMLVSALYNGEFDKLRICFEDRIHQPYRKNLIKDSDLVFEKVKELGAVGEFISGSGSTLMAVINKNEEDKFQKELKIFLDNLEDQWELVLLEPDTEGVRVEKY